MKKTFANLVQKSLAAALLIAGVLFFSASRVEAQDIQSVGTSWVDAGEAMLRIKADVDALANDPQVQVTGSDSNIRVHYFKSVYRRIDGGEAVPNAVIGALGPVNNPNSATAVAPVPGVNLSQAQRNNLLNYMKSRLAL